MQVTPFDDVQTDCGDWILFDDPPRVETGKNRILAIERQRGPENILPGGECPLLR